MDIKLNLTANQATMINEALDFYMAENNSLNADMIVDIQDKIDMEMESRILAWEAQ